MAGAGRWRWGTMPLAGLIGLTAVVFGGSPGAEAGGLKDAIANLYGGDGIRLEPVFGHDPHFTVSSLSGLESLSSNIAAGVNLFSFNSTVSSFTFDIERGIPVRTTESFGPLLAERAPTIGAGKLNVGWSYTHIEHARFDGKRLEDLSLTFNHEDTNGDGVLAPFEPMPGVTRDFELDQIRVDLDLEIEQDVLALFATYGVTRNLDLGIVVPIIRIRLEANANATIVDNSPIDNVHVFGPNSDPQTSRGGGEEVGFGDILLRGKYNFVRDRSGWPDLAAFSQVKLPTGDEDDLLGTGETNLLGLLAASKTLGPVTPHVNVGYEITTGSSELNNARYVGGFDARLHPRLTTAVDVLGRWEPDGDGIGDHLVDAAVGAKWNVSGATLVSGFILLPLNRNDGLRPDVVWGIGIETTF
jgi:hypothetical protein